VRERCDLFVFLAPGTLMADDVNQTRLSEKHYHGHRQRLRQRFLEQGLEGFQDYEALELLLQFVARQKDMKLVAKDLIERFGSFKNVLDASVEELEGVEGVGPAAVTLIHLTKEAAARYLQQTSQARFSPDSPEALRWIWRPMRSSVACGTRCCRRASPNS
jgi:DNA repair protein RadC